MPKSARVVKANLSQINADEFAENYNVFKVTFKDILHLMKQNAPPNSEIQ